MSLTNFQKEQIKAELIARTNYLETTDFNAAKEDIEKQLAKNSDNKYAQDGLSFMKDLIEHLHTAAMYCLEKEDDKLSREYTLIGKMDAELPPENPNWLSHMVWTEESKQEFCIKQARFMRTLLIGNHREFTREVNKYLKDKTLSESDKYYCRYYKELNNSIYDVKRKILDAECSKLLQGAS